MSTSRPLPSWATYTPQTNPGKTSLKDEEFQLRQRAFQCASQRVTQAYNHTIEKHVHEVLTPLRSFFLQFQPGGGGHKRRRVSNCDQQDRFDFKEYIESIQYHPTLLPIAVVHLSPSVQDRAQIVKAMKRRLNPFPKVPTASPNEIRIRPNGDYMDNAEYRPAVCILTDAANGSGYRDHGEYIRDILIQCVQQEPNPYQFVDLLTKRSSKSLRLGYTERLVEWASLTDTFNSIVVIFENPEAIQHRNLDALVGTISNLRSNSGVPISLIMCSIFSDLVQGRLSTLNSYSIDGEAGVVVRDFSMTSSNVLYSKFHHQ